MIRKSTNYIVIHCSATHKGMDIGAKEIGRWHADRGWSGIGYHSVIRRNGDIEEGRDYHEVGAHVKGYNSESVGVCLVGGADRDGEPENNFTPEQWKSLRREIQWLRTLFPRAMIVGHRDLSPDLNGDGIITPDERIKECPSFEVKDWLKDNNLS